MSEPHAADAPARGAVDRVEFLSVEGWCLRADGAAAEPSLWCAGVRVAAALERVARPDVQAHWGETVALESGFVLRPDTTTWHPPAGHVPCELRFDNGVGAQVDLGLSESDLFGWIHAVADAPESAWRDTEQARVRALLWSGRAGADRADLLRWAERRWADGPPPASDNLRFAVEHADGLRVGGWVSDAAGVVDVFSVHCARGDWPVTARRIERADVMQAVPGAGPACGFELDLPSDIWAATGREGDALVQVRVNGRPLWPRGLRVARAGLVPALQAASTAYGAATIAPAADGESAARAEERRRLGHLIEHVAAAGLLARLPDVTRAALRRQFAKVDWAHLEAATSPTSSDEPAPPRDEDRVVWRLQREFNERLDAAVRGGMPHDEALAPALDAALATPLDEPADEPVASTWQDFLVSLVPGFCAAGRLASLRPHLAQSHLAHLEEHGGRWEASLLLPIVLGEELPGGGLGRTRALAERLTRHGRGGWLNTETLRHTLERLHDALRAGEVVDDIELHGLVEALLDLWDGLAAEPWWSRLPDEELLRGRCALLRCVPWLDDSQGERVVQAALSQLGLLPAFWRTCLRAWPALHEWPPALARARAQVEPLLLSLESGSAEAWLREDGRGLRGWQGGDADSLRRHATVSLRGDPKSAEPWLAGLPPEDALRIDAQAWADVRIWRRVAPVPVHEQPGRRAAAWQAAAQLVDAPAGQHDLEASLVALRSACSQRSGWLGLPLLLEVARGATERGDRPDLADAALAALDGGLSRALAACARHPTANGWPPAAVAATCTGLASWACESAAPEALRRLHAHWQAEAVRLWGPMAQGAALPETPVLRSAMPGVGVLLVLRADPAATDEALAQRADAWRDALQHSSAARFDLCVWQPLDSATATGIGPVGRWPRLRHANLHELLGGLRAHSDHGHFLLLPVDAELAVDTWLARTNMCCAHYHGPPSAALQMQLRFDAGVPRIDASPIGTAFASVASGLGLSRHAMAWAFDQQGGSRPPRGAGAAHDEHKQLADLLASQAVLLDTCGYAICHAGSRQAGDEAAPFFELPPPGAGSPTVLLLGDAQANEAGPPPARRIWPTDRPPRLVGAQGSQQLVCRSDPFGGARLAEDDVVVCAVARNELVVMPHFLAHYRALGVRCFAIADNLSTDGTREYLAAQPDVVLYSVDTPYRLSHYGVAWQQALLAEHAQGRWALVVDIDEFLVWPGSEQESLARRCARLAAGGSDAALALMVDMYPEGPLDTADFERGAPFAEAPFFDTLPVRRWRLGSGSYSNSPSFVSSARHRMLPGSAPNHYTAQKVPLVRYQPFVRWSEGLHYAAGVQRAPEPLFIAHFKYHRGFRAKVEEEVARKQHYNDAQEYRKYRELWAEARGIMFDPAFSRRYTDSTSFADIPWT